MSGITVQLDTMPAPVMAAHCRGLFEAIGSFFDDPDNQAKFEAWHKKKASKWAQRIGSRTAESWTITNLR